MFARNQSSTTPDQDSFTQQFECNYDLSYAHTEDLKKETYKIRYQVYCNEMKTENPDLFPTGHEQDEEDAHSIHFLLRAHDSHEPIGCVRMISSDNRQHTLPFEKLCAFHLYPEFEEKLSGLSHFMEVSRLAVREPFRRVIYAGEQTHKKDFNLLMLGPLSLYLATLAYSRRNGMEHGFAMMEPRLARRLRVVGLPFVQIGAIIDYHGQRAPYMISQEDALKNLSPGCSKLLELIDAQLEASLKPQPDNIIQLHSEHYACN